MTVEAETWRPPANWVDAYKRKLARYALREDANPKLSEQLAQWQRRQNEQGENDG